MNQILYSRKADNKSHIIIISIIVIAVIAAFLFGFGVANLFNEKILKGVSIAENNVSKMTKEEALAAINDSQIEDSSKRIVLTYEGLKIALDSSELGYGLETPEELVEKAYSYGRDGNIIENNFTVLGSIFNKKENISVEKTLDSDKLKSAVEEQIRESEVFSNDDFYEVSGERLIITRGVEGVKIDFETLKSEIIASLVSGETYVDIPTVVSKPKELNIDEVYVQIHTEPKNATYVTGDKFEIIAESNGVDFDVNDVKAKYAELQLGESVTIDLTITKPEIAVGNLGDVLFNNLISTYTSKYDTSDKERVTNLEVAASRCNNTILYPGDEFSFNKALGHRTTANGFKMGNSFANGKIVKTVGGGICQVSSSLYNAALRADLTITDRTAHGMYVQYVEQSTDATVVDDVIDFKFRNDRKYPVKIVTTCENGVVTASIYGYKDPSECTINIEVKVLETNPYSTQKQNDATMKKGTTKVVQKPVNGYVSEAYKVYMKDGKEIKRELISKDTYSPIAEIIKVGTKEEIQVIEPVIEPNPEVLPENPLLPPGWNNPESGY